VLLDTEPLYTEATQQVISPFGKVFEWSVKGHMIGRSSVEGARYLVRALDLPISPEEFLRQRRPRLEALFGAAPEIPGARAFVEELWQRRIPAALATSSERALYELKTARHSWFAGFAATVCGDDPRLSALKPAPDIFLTAAAELGVAPEHCLVFEDSLAGVSAARAAGMQVVALPDPNMDASRYADADLVIQSYSDITLADLGF
jgi:pseudouridine-5'-monophosphatase